jgi:hypothetical protein
MIPHVAMSQKFVSHRLSRLPPLSSNETPAEINR